MHLLGDGDRELLAELKEAGLINPETIERVDVALGRPESLTLDEFLLGGAEVIRSADWLSWLIRRHGCHRYGPVVLAPGMGASAGEQEHRRAMTAPSNLPYRKTEHGHWMVALLRPDRKEEAISRWGSQRIFWAAATLMELRELRAGWQNAVLGRGASCDGTPDASPRS